MALKAWMSSACIRQNVDGRVGLIRPYGTLLPLDADLRLLHGLVTQTDTINAPLLEMRPAGARRFLRYNIIYCCRQNKTEAALAS